MKKYQPIDCGFYDHFEQAIVRGRPVTLVHLNTEDLEVESRQTLKDLRTAQKEEFVQLESGTWLRLDRVISINGVKTGSSGLGPSCGLPNSE